MSLYFITINYRYRWHGKVDYLYPTFLAVVCSWFLIIQPQKSYLTRIIFIENRRSSSCFLFSFSLYSFFVAKMSSLFDLSRVCTLSCIRTLTFVRKEKSSSMLSFCARGKVPCLVNRTLDGLLCVKWIWNLFCTTNGCIGLRKLILHVISTINDISKKKTSWTEFSDLFTRWLSTVLVDISS